jgi:hypothetical protein
VPRRAVFVPSQVVIKDAHPLSAIYFINRGFANTLINLGSSLATDGKVETVTGVLGPLEHFGLESFVKRGKVKLSTIAVRTVTYCDMMGLAITDLTAIIAANNLEWAKEKAVQAERARESAKHKFCQMGITSNFIRKLRLGQHGTKADANGRTSAGGGEGGGAGGDEGASSGAPSRLVAAMRGKADGGGRAEHGKAGGSGHGGARFAGLAKASLAGKRCQFAIASAQKEVAERAVAQRDENGEYVDGFYGTVAAMVAQARLNSIQAAKAEEHEANKHRRHLVSGLSLHQVTKRSSSPVGEEKSQHSPSKNVGWTDGLMDHIGHAITDAISGGEKPRGAMQRSKTRTKDEKARLRQRQQARAAAHAACGGATAGAISNGPPSLAQRKSSSGLQFV